MHKDSIKAITPTDYWWSADPSDEMPIYSIDGALYCASGWNEDDDEYLNQIVDFEIR